MLLAGQQHCEHPAFGSKQVYFHETLHVISGPGFSFVIPVNCFYGYAQVSCKFLKLVTSFSRKHFPYMVWRVSSSDTFSSSAAFLSRYDQ